MEPALTAFFGVFIWHNLSTLSKQRDHDDEDDNVKSLGLWGSEGVEFPCFVLENRSLVTGTGNY